MFKLANGWTKKKVLAQVKKFNNGTQAMNMGISCFRKTCVYKNEDGNRCFIGAFIPSRNSALEAEGPVSDLLEMYPELRSKLPFDDVKALSAFQNVHDECEEGSTYLALQRFLANEVE
jgi:hypothetical protein